LSHAFSKPVIRGDSGVEHAWNGLSPLTRPDEPHSVHVYKLDTGLSTEAVPTLDFIGPRNPTPMFREAQSGFLHPSLHWTETPNTRRSPSTCRVSVPGTLVSLLSYRR